LFAEALTIAEACRALPMLLKVLVNLAAVFAETGQRPQAAELLALAVGHKASEQATQDKCWRLLDDMDLDLPDTNDKAVETIVTELLAYLTRRG
jgi:hypothetical protein